MSKIKSWSKLFILVLLVFAFVGCGGGGGGSSSNTPTSDTLTWDTDPNKTTPVTPEPSNPEPSQPEPTPEPVTPTPEPSTPEPVTPEPEPEPSDPEPVTPEPVSFDPVQPEPTQPEPSAEDTYTDTYNIASVLNGEWYEVSGSGIAIGKNEIYHLFLSSLSASFTGTQITGNTGITYLTQRQFWDCPEDPDYGYLGTSDNAELSLKHIGSNTWQHIAYDGTTITIKFMSNAIAMITSEGTINVNSDAYQLVLNYTIQKRGYDNIQDTYDIASVMNGNWYGVGGSGTATGLEGIFDLQLLNMTFSASGTQISGNIGASYITTMQYWSYTYINGSTYITPLQSDNALIDMVHVGNNTWQLKASDYVVNDTIMTITFTSQTTATVAQEGIAVISNHPYSYSLKYTIRKNY